MNPIKLAVITPVYGTYEQQYINSLMNCFARPNSGILFDIISPCGSSNVTQARNISIQDVYIKEEAFKGKFDYLLFVDSDIIFTFEDIQKLLSHKKDVAAGIYFAKSYPFFPVAGYYDIEKILNGFPKITKDQVKSKELIEVDWVGCGFFLLKRDIIDKMEYPWFEMRVLDLPKPLYRSGNITIKKEILSEDITFCTKMRDLGYKIYCDTSISLKHIGKSCFTSEHFLAV